MTGMATKVPKDVVKLTKAMRINIRVILFRKNPRKLVMSSVRFKKSFTWGLRIDASVRPATQPVAISGCSVATGAETADAMIVRGWASMIRAPMAAQLAVITDQDRIMLILDWLPEK